VPNAIVQAFRRQFPNDPRSDDEITSAIAAAYPDRLAGYSQEFPDFHNDLLRLSARSGPTTPPPEIIPYPPTVGEYAKQALGSGIRSAAETLGSVPRAFGTAARIAGTYSVPGAEHVPMRFETEPGFIEQAIPRLGEAVSPEPVPELQKSFLATTLPGAVGSSVGFLAGGAVAGAAEMGIVRAIGTRAMARAAASGLAEAEALSVGQAAAQSAARRLSYGNIASLGALSQAQQGYDEAQRAGADEHTRFLSFALNLPVGMTEAVPLANMLSRMDKLSGGTLKKGLLTVGVDTFEEALQNSLQGVAGDVIASRIAKYDPDRKLFSSLAEDAAAGGISAAILSLATSAIGGKLRRGPPTATREEPAAAPAGPAAADVAAQYASEAEKAGQHAARMLDVARRTVFGGYGPDEQHFVATLTKEQLGTLQGMVINAGKEKDAIDQGIEQQRGEEERRRNDEQLQAAEADRQRQAQEQGARAAGGVGGSVSPEAVVGGLTLPSTTSDSPPGTGGQPIVAPEKGIVPPAPTLVAPVPVPVPPPPAVPAVIPIDIPPVLEAIAQKVASPTGQLTPDEIATLPKTTDPYYALFHQRVAQLRGVAPAPVTAPAPAAQAPARPPLPSPVAPVAPPVVTPAPPTGILSKAKAKAVALATTVQRKVASVVHASPVLDDVDFDGDSPLTFELSGRGAARGTATQLAPVDPNLVVISRGQYEGHRGTLVPRGDEEIETDTSVPAKIKLDSGNVVTVAKTDFTTLASIRKSMQEGQGTGKKVVLSPAYFELTEVPTTEAEVQDAGLVSQASIKTEKPPGKGSKNSWTHRWTVFRNENRIYFLPTYKAEGKVFAMEAGKKKGTQVVELIKRGYTPIASFRATNPVHAADAPKPVLGADEFERTFASHARERMSASARTAAAFAASQQPATQAVTEETIRIKGVERELPGAEEVVTGGATEPTTEAVRPVDLSFSDQLAKDIYPTLTKVLAATTGKLTRENTIEAIVKYAKKGKYGDELRTEVAAIAQDIGEAEASRAVLKHFVRSYNNSRSSKEFADALSGRTGRTVQPALARAGERGLPGPASDLGAGPVQPAAAVPAPAGNAGVAGPTQPKFRAADGGYSTSTEVTSKLSHLLDTLSIAGADVGVVQAKLMAMGREIGGAQLGNRIVLAMADITRPTSENLIAAIHETIHWLSEREGPEMQAKLHRAVEQLRSGRLEVPAGVTDPEEVLAYGLEKQGVDAITARSWGQRIMRALKDLWYRATMAIQEAFMGPGSVNPERVVAYFTNRVNSFLAGDNRPMSFINFLGGAKPSAYRETQFYTATSGTSALPMVILDWNEGALIHDLVVPEGSDAAIHNIDSAVRAGWKFREMEPVFAGEAIGGENPTVRAGQAFAAAKHLQQTLDAAYAAFNATGNNTTAAGTTLLTPEDFARIWKGDHDLPGETIDGIQEKLDAISAPHPHPYLSIDGPVTFENDASRQQARAMTLLNLKGWWARMQAVFGEEAGRFASLAKAAATKIDRHEQLALKFEAVTTTLDAAKEDIREMIAQTKADIRSFVADAKRIGMLSQAIKEFETNVGDPLPLAYEHIIDKMANRLFSDADHFTQFLQDAAALNLNWHGLTMPQIKQQLHTLLSTNPLFSGLSEEDQNVALAMVGAFARTNDHHMAWLAVRATNDHEARDAIREILKEARKGGTANLNAAKAMAVGKTPRIAAYAQRVLTRYTQALADAQSVIGEQLRNSKIIQAHTAAAPVFQQAINDLERPLTARKLFPPSVVEGA
jgi:hypothetical protein